MTKEKSFLTFPQRSIEFMYNKIWNNLSALMIFFFFSIGQELCLHDVVCTDYYQGVSSSMSDEDNRGRKADEGKAGMVRAIMNC